MASPAVALRNAMQPLLDREPVEIPGGTLTEQLITLYGSNGAIADAAGLPTSAQAGRQWLAIHGRTVEMWRALPSATQRRWIRAAGSEDSAIESYRNGLTLADAGRSPFERRRRGVADVRRDARRERQSFLRNLQRYEDETRQPRGMTRRLERLRDEQLDRLRDLHSYGGLAQRFVDEGVTCLRGHSVLLRVSDDERWRYNIPAVTFGGNARYALAQGFVTAVADRDWLAASRIFFDDTWGRAYGAGFVRVLEVEDLELVIGNTFSAYGMRRAS